MPFVDVIRYRHSLKEVAIDIPAQVCITRDNVQVGVDGILYMKVLNPERASYGISDYVFAISQLAQTTLRSEIGKIDLDRTFEERTNINLSVVAELDKATEPWGVKVLRYEIKNITPPQDVLAAMEKQMRAEREKRAVILTSEGTRDAAINNAEGDKQQVIKASEAGGSSRSTKPKARRRRFWRWRRRRRRVSGKVADAIQQPGGLEATQLRVAEQLRDAVRQPGEGNQHRDSAGQRRRYRRNGRHGDARVPDQRQVTAVTTPGARGTTGVGGRRIQGCLCSVPVARFVLWRLPCWSALFTAAGMWTGVASPRRSKGHGGSDRRARAPAMCPTAKVRPLSSFLGDSLTAGLGVLTEESFPSRLQYLFTAEGYDEVEIQNAGVSGDTTAGGLRRVQTVLAPNVKIAVVALGGNDALRGLSATQTRDNLIAIINTFLESGVQVLLAGMEAPTNLGEDYRMAFRNAYSQIAADYRGRIRFIPFLLEGVGGVPALNQADGIHPNVEGAQAVANHIYPTLRDLVDELPPAPVSR